MKKFMIMLLVGLMLVGGAIATYAEEPQDTLMENLLGEGQDIRGTRLGEPKLKEFIEEIHSINDLRIERNQLRAQVIEKHDQLIDLLIAAKEEGDKEELKSVKTEREKLKAINAEIKTLHEQAEAARKAFKEALKGGDSETAGAELEKLINAHSAINDKTESKIQILDNIINILS